MQHITQSRAFRQAHRVVTAPEPTDSESVRNLAWEVLRQHRARTAPHGRNPVILPRPTLNGPGSGPGQAPDDDGPRAA